MNPNPTEITVVVRNGGGNEYYSIPAHSYTKVMELVQPRSKL